MVWSNLKGAAQIAVILIVMLAIIGAAGWFVFQKNTSSKSENSTSTTRQITNFDECVAAGNPVMESYPEQCAANGQTFTNTNQAVEEKAEWTTYSKVPKELQDQIMQTYKEKASGCLENGQIVNFERQPTDISVIFHPRAAEALIGCDGGFRGIYAKNKEDMWQFVLGTQSGIPCETITQYSIPESLLKIDVGPNTTRETIDCIDAAGNTKQYSDLYL